MVIIITKFVVHPSLKQEQVKGVVILGLKTNDEECHSVIIHCSLALMYSDVEESCLTSYEYHSGRIMVFTECV